MGFLTITFDSTYRYCDFVSQRESYSPIFEFFNNILPAMYKKTSKAL